MYKNPQFDHDKNNVFYPINDDGNLFTVLQKYGLNIGKKCLIGGNLIDSNLFKVLQKYGFEYWQIFYC